jgi:hypothetical protein
MKTQSRDTSPEIEKLQFDLLRRVGVSKRLQLARAQTASAIHMARRRIAKRHLNWTEQQVALEWARLTYGDEVVGRLASELKRRGQID